MTAKMSTRSRLLLWIASNILVLVTLPPLFASWVWRSVQEEYRLGYPLILSIVFSSGGKLYY
jgi:uncharacterized membrane protein